MRIKLVAKCKPGQLLCAHEVQVVNADTGEPLDSVRSVSFHADPDGNILLRLEVFPSEIEIEAPAEVVPPPGPTDEDRARGYRDVSTFASVVRKLRRLEP